MSKGERLEGRERAAEQAVDCLREQGYFREGERCVLVLPEEGEKWVAKYEVTALRTPPIDVERSKRFPMGDHLEPAFAAAGYRVSACPDFENMSDDAESVEYYLYAE
ncbi:MAG: hypothetical protein AAB554_05835 [Patescibacteria group bacterium]